MNEIKKAVLYARVSSEQHQGVNSGFEEGNGVGKLEIGGGRVLRGGGKLLGAVGADDVEAHQIGRD